MARIAGVDIPRDKQVANRPDLYLRHRPHHQPEDPGADRALPPIRACGC